MDSGDPANQPLAHRLLTALGSSSGQEQVPEIEIHISNGSIALQGIVQDEQQRRSILQALREAAGEVAIEDNLRLAP